MTTMTMAQKLISWAERMIVSRGWVRGWFFYGRGVLGGAYSDRLGR